MPGSEDERRSFVGGDGAMGKTCELIIFSCVVFCVAEIGENSLIVFRVAVIIC